MKAWRIILAVAGSPLARSESSSSAASETPLHSLVVLALWLAAALVLDDAILAPSVVRGMAAAARLLRPERRFAQVALPS